MKKRELDCYQAFEHEVTLKYVAQFFFGQCITSNPVEIVNSQLRRVFRMTGPWLLQRAELSLLAFMLLKKEIIQRTWIEKPQAPEQNRIGEVKYELVPVLA